MPVTDGTAPRIRHADFDDAEQIAALHAVSWQRHYRGAYSDSFLDGDVLSERRAVWTARLAEPAATVTVLAEDDLGLAGFVLRSTARGAGLTSRAPTSRACRRGTTTPAAPFHRRQRASKRRPQPRPREAAVRHKPIWDQISKSLSPRPAECCDGVNTPR
ncbi:MAG TPA: hypothetical protein VIP98_18990 [Microlunatus sp.]